MLRYKREVKIWKEKKELESEAQALAKHSNFISQMNASFSSQGSESSFLDALPDEGRSSMHNRSTYDSFNSSVSSMDSRFSEHGGDPESMQQMIQRQQQLLQQQLREVNPQFMGTTFGNQSQGQQRFGMPGSNAFHSSFSSMPQGMLNDFQPMPQQQQSQMMMMQQQQQPQRVPMGNNSFSDFRPSTMGQNSASFNMMGSASFNGMQQNSFGNNNTMGNNMNNNMGNNMNNMNNLMHNDMNNPMQTFGHSSSSSLQVGDALLGPSNHVSDYSTSVSRTSNHTTSGFNSSFQNSGFASHSSGFNAADGLVPPSAVSSEGMNLSDSYHIQTKTQNQQGNTMNFGDMDMDRSFHSFHR